MSAGGSFGGARGYQPRPPEKGVFPLDHFGECKQVKEAYAECLRANDNAADACRDLAKQYLECRMERQLMAQQDLRDLGFADGEERRKSKAPEEAKRPDPREKERSGFLAGTAKFNKT